MKQYKFQALVALYDGDGGTHATLGREPRRMVVRGRNDESGHSQIYTALISCDDERPFRPDSPRFLATLRLAGDDVTDDRSLAACSFGVAAASSHIELHGWAIHHKRSGAGGAGVTEVRCHAPATPIATNRLTGNTRFCASRDAPPGIYG